MTESDILCPRGRTDCKPCQVIMSDCKTSFVCAGLNDGMTRNHEQDILTHCWKSADTDDLFHMDERDFIHTIFVMSSALALLADIKQNAKSKAKKLDEEKGD